MSDEKKEETIKELLDKIKQPTDIINKPVDCYRNAEITSKTYNNAIC